MAVVTPPREDPGITLRSRAGVAIVSAAVLGSALAYPSDDMLNVALPSVSTAIAALTIGSKPKVARARE